ncbi:acyl carrier protein [Paenibacillus sp. 4624]|uniref:Acyl carrier protein n=1 Tax=Paenibacillus amylolyticus TaxID=1451 RepID=A0A5M9WU76_PAEAM|nr:acyl carrier protein [Paenibacillus amylolyticus]KAA8785038.1 acyl carrier protein [Paenibacillus amylolyticus]
MDQHAMRLKILSNLQEILEISDDIMPDENLEAIGLNSLKSIILIVKLEEGFEVTFNDEELLFENFSTINRIIQSLQSTSI